MVCMCVLNWACSLLQEGLRLVIHVMTYMAAETTSAFWKLQHKPSSVWELQHGKVETHPHLSRNKDVMQCCENLMENCKAQHTAHPKVESGSFKARIFLFQHSPLTEVNQIILPFGWVPVQQTPPRRVILGNESHSYAIGCAFSPLFVFFSCIIYSSVVPFFPEWLASHVDSRRGQIGAVVSDASAQDKQEGSRRHPGCSLF